MDVGDKPGVKFGILATARDIFFGRGKEDTAEGGLPRSTRGRLQFPQAGELLLGFTGEALPIGLLKVSECVAREVRDV